MNAHRLEPTPHDTAAFVSSHLPLALFDHVGSGLVVCDADGHAFFINQAARHEMAAGRLLSAVGGQVQRAAGADGELIAALRAAAQRGRRSLVRLTQGKDRLMLSTLPFRLPGLDEPLVLLVFGRRHGCSPLELELLAGSYGLTGAERRVLAGLVREANPREIADEHAVKLSTVRTQISSIRSKLGARSIEGLLLRAAEMPPVASALRAAA